MSQQALKRFLNNLDKQLKNSSDAYRSATANKKDHSFELTERAIEKSLEEALKYSDNLADLSVKDVKHILSLTKPGIQKFIESVKNNFVSLKAGSRVKDLTVKILISTPTRLVVDLTVPEKNESDIFNTVIRGNYTVELNDFYQKFLNILQQFTGQDKILFTNEKGKTSAAEAQNVFNLEHSLESSNVKKFVEESAHKAFSSLSKADQVLLQKDSSLLDNTGILLGIDRLIDVSLEGPQSIAVFLGSSILNRLESIEERKIVSQIQRDLKSLLISSNIPNLSGSDTVEQIETKRVIKKLKSSLEKGKSKKIKVNFESTKVKGKPKTTESIKAGGTVTKGRAKAKSSLKKKRVNKIKPKNTLPNLQMLIGVINQQLPRTVAKNMGDPRLNYKTGRFASSVEVTDITTTAKGFPSIGYTYDKFPYQTFEPGYRQGSVDRDPRKLIDTSIREIAAQFAIGRFYTRRV